MSYLTGEELCRIYYHLCSNEDWVIKNKDIMDKLMSMIDNYCEHEFLHKRKMQILQCQDCLDYVSIIK